MLGFRRLGFSRGFEDFLRPKGMFMMCCRVFRWISVVGIQTCFFFFFWGGG